MMSGSGRDQLLEQLGAALLDAQRSERERVNAKRALARLGDEAILAYLAREALEAASTAVSLDVLDLLATRRQLGEIELSLVGFLYDASPEVRRKAIEVLGNKGSDRMQMSLEQIIDAAMEEDSILGPDDVAVAEVGLQRMRQRFA